MSESEIDELVEYFFRNGYGQEGSRLLIVNELGSAKAKITLNTWAAGVRRQLGALL